MSYQQLLFIIICAMFLLATPLTAKAQDGCPPGSICIPNPLQEETVEGVLAAITGLLRNIAILLGTIMIIISGIQYLTSAGSEERATKAKKTMFYTVIGVVIVIAVDFIMRVIREILGNL